MQDKLFEYLFPHWQYLNSLHYKTLDTQYVYTIVSLEAEHSIFCTPHFCTIDLKQLFLWYISGFLILICINAFSFTLIIFFSFLYIILTILFYNGAHWAENKVRISLYEKDVWLCINMDQDGITVTAAPKPSPCFLYFSIFFFFLFLLLTAFLFSGVATANHRFPFWHILCIFYSDTNYLHVLPHYIHKSPLRPTSSPPTW